MHDENKRLAKRALDEVFSGGRLDTLDEIFHPDFINHEAGPQTPPGRDGLKVTLRWMRSSFSDLRYEVQDAIAEDDKVVLRVMSKGRHTGEFMGFPATGREFAAKQIHIYRIVDRKSDCCCAATATAPPEQLNRSSRSYFWWRWL